MNKIPVVISGFPGNMAVLLAGVITGDERFYLSGMGLTGPEMSELKWAKVGEREIRVHTPASRAVFLEYINRTQGNDRKEPDFSPPLIADFTHPDAVIENAQFYCDNNLPFVMGTTGGDRQRLVEIVQASNISAVIAPNMAAQVVALQAAIEYMAKTFPNAFAGFELDVTESHQQAKADTSGTAKALIASFRELGVDFNVADINMIRSPAAQLVMGIPEQYLGGHGWHEYELVSEDKTMAFGFVHNINGRIPYVAGTLKALAFLSEQVATGVKGKVFSMVDVLKAG